MKTERHEPTTGGLKKISNFFKENNFLGLKHYSWCLTLYLWIFLVFFCNGADFRQTPRVALIYSDSSPSKEDYDDIFQKLDWTCDKWKNTQLEELIEKLSNYDIILCGRIYNGFQGQNVAPFENFTAKWLDFIKRGGVIIVAPVTDSSPNWINTLSPSMQFETGMISTGNLNAHPNPEIPITFSSVRVRWAEFKTWSPEWKVMNKTDNGMPIVMYQEINNGLIIVSCAYYTRKGLTWVNFPKVEDFRRLWDYIEKKRATGSPVKLLSISFGEKNYGQNSAKLVIENISREAEITATLSLFRNKDKIFTTSCAAFKIPIGTTREFILPYYIDNTFPDFITLTITDSNGKILLQTNGKIPVGQLNKLLKTLDGKMQELRAEILFLEHVSSCTLLPWLKTYINDQQEFLSLLRENYGELKKQITTLDIKQKQQELTANINESIDIAANKINTLKGIIKRVKTCYNFKLQVNENTSFILSSASSMKKIFRDDAWNEPVAEQLNFQMAANEYESVQLVIVPLAKELKQVNISCGDLISRDTNAKIDSKNINIKRVGYVFLEDGKWYPDPLLKNRIFDIPCGQVVQPLWITVHAPPGTKPGIYKGELSVQAQDPKSTICLPVVTKVWNFTIPSELSLFNDANVRLYSLARFYYGKAGRENPEKYIPASTYRNFLKFLLNYRIMPKPWDDSKEALACIPYLNANSVENGLPLDFTEYDKNVEFILQNGGKLVSAGGHPMLVLHDSSYNLPITRYIPLIYEHLREKGWANQAYFHSGDEPKIFDLAIVKEELCIVQKVAPGMKRLIPFSIDTVAQKLFSESKEGDYIWVLFRSLADKPFYKTLRKREKFVWMYDAGGKTELINTAGIENRIYYWIIRKYNVNGFHRWGTVRWPGGIDDIQADGTPNKTWSSAQLADSGDGYCCYPAGKKIEDGLNPSIRLEIARDGIEDWEYFSLIEKKIQELRETSDSRYEKLIEEGESLLIIKDELVKNTCMYTTDYNKILAEREKMAKFLEKMNRDCVAPARSKNSD